MTQGMETLREFVPPLPRAEAEKLPKRETLELVKPVLREHDKEQETAPPRYMERDPFRDARWNWIYASLREGGDRRGWLGQARREIECEDEFGHYWEPAYTTLRLIEDGWHKWEAEVVYPRPVRRGKDDYLRRQEKRFRSKRRAERWLAEHVRWYARYIERLLAEGLYDQSGYER